MTMWLKNTDEWTEANYETVRVISVYDNIQNARFFDEEKHFYQAQNSKEFFMKPNQKYTFKLYPKWAGIMDPGNTLVKGKNHWIDADKFNTLNSLSHSLNGYQLYINGNNQQKITFRVNATYTFMGLHRGNPYP